jgi:DNA modification methylase
MIVETIGDATLYLGDCMEIMPTLGKVDAVVTSPPYGEMRDYGGEYTKNPINVINTIQLAEGGICVWNVSDQVVDGSESGESFKQALAGIERGWRLHDTMIWCKGRANVPSTNRYLQAFEYIFIFSNGAPTSVHLISDRKNVRSGERIGSTSRKKDGGLRRADGDRKTKELGVRFNYWNIPGEQSNLIRTGHPAQMSQKLCIDLVYSFTNEQGQVLDPFMGSGTTGIACMNLGRKFIGIELNRLYFDIACERIENAQRQTSLFDQQQEEVGVPAMRQAILGIGEEG